MEDLKCRCFRPSRLKVPGGFFDSGRDRLCSRDTGVTVWNRFKGLGVDERLVIEPPLVSKGLEGRYSMLICTDVS